jgi:hypothetical protein
MRMPVAAIAKNPRITITAIAQRGNESSLEGD